MTRLLVATLLSLYAACAMSQDNATLYFYGPAPSVDTVQKLAAGASTSVARSGAMTTVTVRWPDVSVEINIDPDWPREVQLSGIQGWLGGFPKEESGQPEVVAFIANLKKVTTAYGSVIVPQYDSAGKVFSLLRQLVAAGGGGFFFSRQSFYDMSGQRLIGTPGDPETLSPK
jgi:hypothetical protein